MQVENHRLKDAGVKFVPTNKHSGEFGTSNLPDTIIIHYTAGRDVASATHILAESDVKASAHIIVGEKGELVQLVDFNKMAWHAGQSEYKGRVGFNRYSIGIEISNPGWLDRSGDTFTTWFGQPVDRSDVVEARHRNPVTKKMYWHRFTQKQIEVVQDLCELLVKTYDIKSILGHEEISPGRKQDPGPAFPLDKMRDKILTGHRDDMGGLLAGFPVAGVVYVNNGLNIRASSSVAAEKVARPLQNNQKVTVLEEKDGWYRVRTEIEGWVAGKYVSKVD